MKHLKLITSFILGMAIVLGQVGSAFAASPRDDDPASITGTIQSIVIEAVSGTSSQTVAVSLLLASGETKTIHLSIETAIALGLVTQEASGELTVDGLKIGTVVEVDPKTVLPEEPVVEEKRHPVGGKIAAFFSNLLGVDYDLVMGSHADGFGFGVITQALWMTNKLGGDVELFQTILQAKKTGDYSLITLPDGSIPQSWGQFKKAVLQADDKKSLGDLISAGKDKPGNGNGKPENPGNENGKPDNTGKDKDKDNNGNGKTK